jgi:hypothetical protein
MSLWAETEIIANEGYFRPTCIMMHPMRSEQPASASLPHDLRDDATCTIRAAPPLVLRQNWKTQVKQAAIFWCMPNTVFILPLVWAQPTNRSPIGFEAQTTKPSWRFFGQVTKPQLPVLRPKPGKHDDHGVEAKPRNPFSSSPCARCRLHTVSPTSRSSGH